jgi:hypothetical protein
MEVLEGENRTTLLTMKKLQQQTEPTVADASELDDAFWADMSYDFVGREEVGDAEPSRQSDRAEPGPGDAAPPLGHELNRATSPLAHELNRAIPSSSSQGQKRPAEASLPSTSAASNQPKKPKLTAEQVRINHNRRNTEKKTAKLVDVEKCSKVFETILNSQRHRLLGGLRFSFIDDLIQQMEQYKEKEKDLWAIWERALYYCLTAFNKTEKILGRQGVNQGKQTINFNIYN